MPVHHLPPTTLHRPQLFNSGSALGKAAAYIIDRVSGALLPSWLLTAHARNTA